MSRMRLLAAAVLVLASSAAMAATPDEVKQKLEKEYDVRVLKIAPGELDGQKVYEVRVMKKGNGSAAFGVWTLAADMKTRELVPVFNHSQANGYTIPDTLSGDPRQVNVPPTGSTWR